MLIFKKISFEDFIKTLVVRFENNLMITVQAPGDVKKAITFIDLKLKNNRGKVWINLMNIIKKSKDHYYYIKRRDFRNDEKEVQYKIYKKLDRKLMACFLKLYNKDNKFTVPNFYTLRENVGKQGSGIFRFKFKIEN